MDAASRLEARITSLEQSRDRYRRAACALGLLVALLSATALMPQAQEELVTQRLVLVRPGLLGVEEGVVLVAGPQASLLIQTPDGAEIARFGGSPARHIR